MSCWRKKSGKRTPKRLRRCAGRYLKWRAEEKNENGQVGCMYDSRIGADHGSADHVGDVWDDDYPDGPDGRRRRLLRGGGAVFGTRRGIKKPEKKTALTSAKVISAKEKTLRF